MFPSAAALLALLARTTLAQNNGLQCTLGEFEQALDHPNATGSYPRASPLQGDNDTIPSGNWTYKTAVTVEDDQVRQRIWVETPSFTGLQNSDFPFQMCAIAFEGLPRATYIKGQQDNGDCLATLSQNCVNTLARIASQKCSGANLAPAHSGDLEACTPFWAGGYMAFDLASEFDTSQILSGQCSLTIPVFRAFLWKSSLRRRNEQHRPSVIRHRQPDCELGPRIQRKRVRRRYRQDNPLRNYDPPQRKYEPGKLVVILVGRDMYACEGSPEWKYVRRPARSFNDVECSCQRARWHSGHCLGADVHGSLNAAALKKDPTGGHHHC